MRSAGSGSGWEVPQTVYQVLHSQVPLLNDQQPSVNVSQSATVCNNSAANAGNINGNSQLGAEGCESPQARVTTRIMNLLSDENKSLRQQLESYVKKAIKLQQVLFRFLTLFYKPLGYWDRSKMGALVLRIKFVQKVSNSVSEKIA